MLLSGLRKWHSCSRSPMCLLWVISVPVSCLFNFWGWPGRAWCVWGSWESHLQTQVDLFWEKQCLTDVLWGSRLGVPGTYVFRRATTARSVAKETLTVWTPTSAARPREGHCLVDKRPWCVQFRLQVPRK